MYNHQRPQEQQQTITGLARYRSAPSSYFALLNRSDSSSHGGLMEAEDFEQIFNLRASSPETHRIFSRFMNSSDNIQEQQQSQSQSQPQSNSSCLPPRKETESNQLQRKRSRDYSTVSQTMYQNHSSEVVNSAMDNSYNRLLGPVSSNRVVPIKMEGGGGSNLIRHCSSPAGLFASMNIENGIILGENGPGDASFDDDRADYNEYIQGRFSINSWDDSEIMSDNFLNANKGVNTSDDQNTEIRDRPATLLSHHLSLPKRSSEISAMEKLLQDSVPCRIRAKRGCATHPRSIAERVRRTKISERMRKLQELVPNMEKQTNTSDMLDLAVDYIKDLQTQVKTLSINRAKCTCLA